MGRRQKSRLLPPEAQALSAKAPQANFADQISGTVLAESAAMKSRFDTLSLLLGLMILVALIAG
jgi:hypothetical protein